jgi:hypothetical protein
MDTRRLSESIAEAPDPHAPGTTPEVEIVELHAVRAPARRHLGRVAFVVGVAVLAGLIAIAGFPPRPSFALDRPLPNIFAGTQAP